MLRVTDPRPFVVTLGLDRRDVFFEALSVLIEGNFVVHEIRQCRACLLRLLCVL